MKIKSKKSGLWPRKMDALRMLDKMLKRMTQTSLVGADIGLRTIKVAEVMWHEEKPHLNHCFVQEIQNLDPSKALIDAVARNGFKSKDVALSLASPELVVRPFHFPKMTHKELTSAIHLEAEQAILNGHTFEEMAIDWQVLGKNPEDAIHGILAVVPKEIASRRVNIVRQAGLTARVVDVAGLAAWNAYWFLTGRYLTTSRPILFLNVGEGVTNIVVAQAPNKLLLVRDIDLGAEALEKGFKEDWILEVHDSMAYARAKEGLRSLEKCVMTGSGDLEEVFQDLSHLALCDVEIWDPLRFIEASQETLLEVQNHRGSAFSLAIGLAMRGEDDA